MNILIKRTYFRKDYTVGFLQVYLSGDYESEYLTSTRLKPSPRGWLWTPLCDTIEPHAIPWVDDLFIGQKAEPHVRGKTAIPEGMYRIVLQDQKTFKRVMPVLKDVPEFKRVVLRTGKVPKQTRGDILVGNLAPSLVGNPADDPHLVDSRESFNTLFSLIDEAIDYGEDVWLEVRSPKGWKYQ